MSKHFLISILVFTVTMTCHSQYNRMENRMMTCLYKSYPDRGKELKQLIIDYQNFLIIEGILTDESEKSYMSLLHDFSNGKFSNLEPTKLFCLEIKKINPVDNEMVKKCHETKINDSVAYKNSKLKTFEQSYFTSKKAVAKRMLKFLVEEDFKLDYYRMQIFLLFCFIDTDAGVNEINRNRNDYDLIKALNIKLKPEGVIFVNNSITSLEVLKKDVRAYVFKNKSESIIVLEAGGDIIYSYYKEVQEAIVQEIHYLREKLSKQMFSSNFDQLSEEQINQVIKVYPQIILE